MAIFPHSRQTNAAAGKWKRYCSFFVQREWKSFECRLCVLCKSCLLLFIYFTSLPVSEHRLCTAISSLEFRFHYSCRLTWESFKKLELRVKDDDLDEILMKFKFENFFKFVELFSNFIYLLLTFYTSLSCNTFSFSLVVFYNNSF